ncbi:MAG: acyl-CoA dehydrogenase [Myxococcota bacterium]
MPQDRFEELTTSPELVALMPLLYVAWADGELGDDEIQRVQKAANVSDAQRETLSRWLDRKEPPSATELLKLYRYVQVRASRLPADKRRCLVELGASVAELSMDDAAARALREVEGALGVKGIAHGLLAPQSAVPQTFDEAAASFDVDAMTAVLDGEYAKTWNAVRELLRRPEFRYIEDVPKADHREQVLRWLQILADEGYGALAFPEGSGGADRMDLFVKSFEALGMFDLSLVVKFGVQFGLFGGSILALGSKRHHDEYLRAVGKLELPGGFAMTELGHGSNVRQLETIAKYDPERQLFVLHSPSASARKEWIGNAALHGRTMTVFAQLETQDVVHGVHAFVVPVRDDAGALLPGVSIQDCGHKMGLNGVDNGRIWFDHVEVPRANLLDRYATVDEDGTYASPIASPSRRFFTMLGTLVGGRVSVGSAAVTSAKSALTIAIRYGALRRQFGPDGGEERPILNYRSHQLRLMPSLAQTYALHFAMADLQAEWRDFEGEDAREIEMEAAGLKAMATWHAIATAQHCRECCGGMGFLTRNRICQILKDVDVFATFEGDNVVLLQLVAKGLLTGYAKSLKNDLVGSLLRELGRAAATGLLEKNPFSSRRTDAEHLDAADFHQAAFDFRKQSLLTTAARRVKKRIDKGMTSFDAFMDIQDHLQSLAMAHVHARVHASFAKAVAETKGEALQGQLHSLRALFAHELLRQDLGWFLENGYVEAPKARAIRRRVIALSEEVRGQSIHLVNAFGIPDEAIGAPIAFENYADNAMLNE